MKLRKLKVIDPLLISQPVLTSRKKSPIRIGVEIALMLLLLTMIYIYFGLLKAKATLAIAAAYGYVRFCISDVFSRPTWNILLLFFCPAEYNIIQSSG